MIFHRLGESLVYLTITCSKPEYKSRTPYCESLYDKPMSFSYGRSQEIIRYLLGTPMWGLFFPIGSNLHLIAFCDANLARYTNIHQSTTKWCMYLGNTLISWKCKKQDCTSKSFTKSEDRPTSSTYSEIHWLRELLSELGFPQEKATTLHVDNTSAIR